MFELGHQKKVLDECSSTMEFFLVKCVHVFKTKKTSPWYLEVKSTEI